MQLYNLNAKENTFWKTQGFIFNYFEEFDKLLTPFINSMNFLKKITEDIVRAGHLIFLYKKIPKAFNDC